MKMEFFMFKKTILMLLLFLSFPAFCAYRNLFWVPIIRTNVDDQSAVLVDDTTEIKVPVYGLTSTYQTGKIVYRTCSDIPFAFNSDEVRQSKTSWLVVPKEIIHKNGVSIEMSIDEANSWSRPYASMPSEYDAKIVQKYINSPLGPCYSVGKTAGLELYWKDAMLTLQLNKQSFKPGIYNIPITYYYAFEEHKIYPGHPGGDSSQHVYKVLQFGEKNSFNLTLDVQSRCLLSSYGPISLSHGRMTPGESVGNKSEPFNINASCDYETPIKIKLTGKELVAGKTSNFTKCGNQGTCELTFNGNEYNKTYKAIRNLDISVTSTFHPIEGKAVEGAFTGGGILTILFE